MQATNHAKFHEIFIILRFMGKCGECSKMVGHAAQMNDSSR